MQDLQLLKQRIYSWSHSGASCIHKGMKFQCHMDGHDFKMPTHGDNCEMIHVMNKTQNDVLCKTLF